MKEFILESEVIHMASYRKEIESMLKVVRKEPSALRKALLSRPVSDEHSYRQGYAAAIEYVLGRIRKDDEK